MESGSIIFSQLHKVGFLLDIQNFGHSKRKVGYLLDFQNIVHSKFDIQIFLCMKRNIQKAVSECKSGQFFFILDIRYLTFALKLVTYWIFKTLDIRNLIFRHW